MNYPRILLGGVVGGIAYNAVSFVINAFMLMPRYDMLVKQEVFRAEPRLPFMALYPLLLFLVSIGLVWLYAAVRPRLGPGPGTALSVGLVVGLIQALPVNLALYSWSYAGGFVSMGWALEYILGCALATLAGGWLYRE